MSVDGNERWFSGAPGRTQDEREFLEQLQRDAAKWSNDVRPADTVAFNNWEQGPMVVGIEIRKITAAYRHLWVSYWSSDPSRRALQGAWGDDLIADDYSGDRIEDLTVAGVEAEPFQFGIWFAQWLASQLKRPVVREEWGPSGNAMTWKLADTNFRLQDQGLWWRRRGPATTIHRER